ncbi:MAG: hypothetical protein KIT54_12065 [Phycisphaeraceae bacterium]|nr:hypothetical protein [Phycisphaeraceae bacterium]
MNRLQRERAISGAMVACVTIACAGATWWATRPIEQTKRTSNLGVPPVSDAIVAGHALDASVFDVVLWPEQLPDPGEPARSAMAAAATPPLPPPPAPQPPPPAPINLTLVAIVEAGDGWRVALYDPSEQRLVLASAGEAVGAVRVREVTSSTVLLELAGRTRRLALQGIAP